MRLKAEAYALAAARPQIGWTEVRRQAEAQVAEADRRDERLTAGRIDRYVARLYEQELSSQSIYGYVDGLCVMAQALAGGDWAWLRKVARLQRRVTPAKPIGPADLISSRNLYRTALLVIKMVERDTNLQPLLRAVRVRDGLLIAFQAAIALRLKNLSAMELGRQLRKEEDRYWVHFAGAEMKTGRPHSEPLPRSLTPYLDCYIELYRPILVRDRRTDAVWVNHYGTALSYVGLDERLAIVTRRHFDREMRSHRFRHCKATTWVDNRPAHARAAAPLLGHTDYRVSQRHYVRGQTILASRAHNELLDGMLEQAREIMAGQTNAKGRS